MARCTNCNSLFFKTLETRHLPNQPTLLHKKRCKRCKFKYVFRQDFPAQTSTLASYDLWRQARRIELSDQRTRILVGEYTRRISGRADAIAPYLHRIERAESRPAGGPGHV